MKEIDQSFEVQVGDVIEIQYKILSFWSQRQVDSIISSLQDERFDVLDYEIMPHTWLNDVLKVKVKINENPFPVAIIIFIIASAGTSIFIYLSLDKIYLIARETPEIVTSVMGTVSILAIAGALIGGYLMFKKV